MEGVEQQQTYTVLYLMGTLVLTLVTVLLFARKDGLTIRQAVKGTKDDIVETAIIVEEAVEEEIKEDLSMIREKVDEIILQPQLELSSDEEEATI